MVRPHRTTNRDRPADVSGTLLKSSNVAVDPWVISLGAHRPPGRRLSVPLPPSREILRRGPGHGRPIKGDRIDLFVPGGKSQVNSFGMRGGRVAVIRSETASMGGRRRAGATFAGSDRRQAALPSPRWSRCWPGGGDGCVVAASSARLVAPRLSWQKMVRLPSGCQPSEEGFAGTRRTFLYKTDGPCR
jgi:3D (Asp-Asp-Asp) domain-containing protein